MTLFLIEYHGDDAGIKQGFSLLEDTVGNPRTVFPRSELLHFLQDAQDFAPVRRAAAHSPPAASAAPARIRQKAVFDHKFLGYFLEDGNAACPLTGVAP